MANFDELKNKGNEYFKQGQFELAIELYSTALEVAPSSHIALSNRSLAFYKLGRYDSALDDADLCVQTNEKWAKGHLRRATALNALGKHKEAKEACVTGFTLQDQQLCKIFVCEWLKASRALVSSRFDPLKKPPWSDVLPEAADLFCDEYCDLLFTISYLRLSDADSMSHDTMVKCVLGSVEIAEGVLSEFRHPTTSSMREWGEAATVRFESHPRSEWDMLMSDLQKKTTNAVLWFKTIVHKSLRQVLDPVLMLALSAMLVRGNVLCQAYTGHFTTEYLGYACIGFFEQGVLTDPNFTAFHMAVLSMILNSYRLRGALDENEVELIRGICHKLENLLHHLPKDHKNFDLITQHYQHTIKVFREICAKVITDFSGSYDPTEALSELELALLKCEQEPDKAMDIAVKYITDIASKTEASQSGGISHINFIDAENMLYITGILTKLGNYDQALSIFHSGESMALSLLATMVEGNVLSLDELPASVTNVRKFALAGAIWLKDHFPNEAADVFIRWKSFFTELRAVLIRLGLRDSYREAFQAIEGHASKGEAGGEKYPVLHAFQTKERQFFQEHALPTVKALYSHDYDSVAQALQKSDVAIDYMFKIYNPEHHNPPESQACALVIRPQKPPLLFTIQDRLVYDLLQQWPEAIYKVWCSQDQEFNQVSKSLSDALFPEAVKKILLDPTVARVFISPDVDLMCFPIDQLPLTDDNGSTLPLYERLSVAILSSPRELLRDKTIKTLQVTSSQSSALEEKRQTEVNTDEIASSGIVLDSRKPEHSKSQDAQKTQGMQESAMHLAEDVGRLQLATPSLECFIVANPDYTHERSGEQPPSNPLWKRWLEAFSGVLGSASSSIPELKSSQKEAEVVNRFLSMNQSFNVHPPLTQKEATISAVLNLKSPHILHIATHGYTSKQESTQYHGNFWADESSGILLAGAQTFLEKKFDRIDARAGTGHMNAIATCGMQLEGTHLVFVSACNSSVGSRPVQEMPDSLTQALRAAGAQTVISTLWVVTDNEAAEFVTHFYNRLVNFPGCRPSEALSYAKTIMKLNGKSMFHWGGYICHGLDIPIES